MAPKLTKREMERAAAAAAAAAASAGGPAAASADALLPLPVAGEVAFDALPEDATYNTNNGGKRRADEAFGNGLGEAGSQGSAEEDAASKVSSASKSTAGGARPKKTPQRGQGQQGETPGGAAADKSMKGLRHFSLKVCKKVEEKGLTNYNEVADELVAEVLTPQVDPLTGELQPPECQYDEKNIRRRVYDALNVLMAMDIISKEKKEIRWKGLPSHAQPDLEVVQRDKRRLEQSLARKKEHLQELLMQRIAFQRLVRRNTAREEAAASAVAVAAQAQAQAQATAAAAAATAGGQEAAATAVAALREEEEARKIPLPFIIINTGSQTVIQCEMTEDRDDVFFNFSAPFEINDDNEVLKRMELQRATPEEVQAIVPPELLRYVPAEVYATPLTAPTAAASAAAASGASAAAAALGAGAATGAAAVVAAGGLDAALQAGGYGHL